MSPREIEVYHKIMEGTVRLVKFRKVEILRYGKWKQLTVYYHPKSQRRKYYLCGGYIYANRLIWMLTWKRPIPAGCCIDHINGDRTDDWPFNLRAQLASESHKQGNEKQLDYWLEFLCDWFEKRGK